MASSLDRQQTQQTQQQASSIVQKFNQFKQQLGGSDPKSIVLNLLNSGKMSRQQFQQLSQTAKNFNFLFR